MGDSPAAPVRLAVIAEGASADCRNLADLLQADLSNRDGIEMVEREEIDRVLAEQAISAAGLVAASERVRLGQVLRAKGLLFVGEETSSNQVFRLRLVETTRGILAGYVVLPVSGSLKPLVQGMVERVVLGLPTRDGVGLQQGQRLFLLDVDTHRLNLIADGSQAISALGYPDRPKRIQRFFLRIQSRTRSGLFSISRSLGKAPRLDCWTRHLSGRKCRWMRYRLGLSRKRGVSWERRSFPQPSQQFAIWPGTQETARSEIAPYPEIIAKRGVYEVGRALRARRSV